jgi:hypothetical protein
MIERRLHISRLRPQVGPDEKADLQVIVLSDWVDGLQGDLVNRVGGVARTASADGSGPIVLVLDDINDDGAKHRLLLEELADAGGIILQPESREEASVFQLDPVQFVSAQVGMITSPPATSPDAGPSDPTGFEQFTKAVTRLSPHEMKDLVEGRRANDDWRFES